MKITNEEDDGDEDEQNKRFVYAGERIKNEKRFIVWMEQNSL